MELELRCRCEFRWAASRHFECSKDFTLVIVCNLHTCGMFRLKLRCAQRGEQRRFWNQRQPVLRCPGTPRPRSRCLISPSIAARLNRASNDEQETGRIRGNLGVFACPVHLCAPLLFAGCGIQPHEEQVTPDDAYFVRGGDSRVPTDKSVEIRISWHHPK